MKNNPAKSLNIISIVIIFLAFTAIIVNVLFVTMSWSNPLDFGSFVASGRFAANGENPYSADSPLIFRVEFPGIDHTGLAPNLNPPISILLFRGLAAIPIHTSLLVMKIGSIILYIISVMAALRYSAGGQKTVPSSQWRLAWLLSLAGFWHCIELGQIYIPLLFIAIVAWICFKKGDQILGGVALGFLIAIKPNFIFWAFALLASLNWKAFITAGIVSLGISLVPVTLYGPEIYYQWLEASSIFSPDLLIFPGNNSLQGLTARFALQELGVWLSVILSAAALIFIAWKKPAGHIVNGIGILVSLLISPIAWTGYTLLVIPILLERRQWNYLHWASAVIFMVPFPVILYLFQTSTFNFIFWGWFYGWGLISLLYTQFWSTKDAAVD